MILKKNENAFVQIAERFGINVGLKGKELVFDTEEDCIKHHSSDHLGEDSAV